MLSNVVLTFRPVSHASDSRFRAGTVIVESWSSCDPETPEMHAKLDSKAFPLFIRRHGKTASGQENRRKTSGIHDPAAYASRE